VTAVTSTPGAARWSRALLAALLVFVAGRCLVPMDETDLFFNLRLMIEIVRKGIMHLRGSEVRIALQDFIYRTSLLVMPGHKTHLDTCACNDSSPPTRIDFVLNIRMLDFVDSCAVCHDITH